MEYQGEGRNVTDPTCPSLSPGVSVSVARVGLEAFSLTAQYGIGLDVPSAETLHLSPPPVTLLLDSGRSGDRGKNNPEK